MKKIIISLNAIFIFVMLLSCDNKKAEVVTVDSFKETMDISFKKIDSIKQLMPGRICFVDSLMIITDWEQNPRIHIYNKNNYKYLGNYGIVGRGPEEFNSPECLCQYENKNGFYLTDYGTSKIYNIDLKSALNKKKTTSIVKEIDIPAKLFYSDYLFITENEIRGDNREIESKNRYFIYDRQKNEINWKGDPNFNIDFLNKVKPEDRKNAGTISLAYSSKKKKIISAFLLFNRIDIMNFNFEIEKQIIFGEKEMLPVSKVPYDSRNIHYFGSVLALENSFLVTYKGRVSDSNKQLVKGEILQYDYEGNPLRRFITEKPVASLFYDEDSKVVYAIVDDMERSIVILKRKDNENF